MRNNLIRYPDGAWGVRFRLPTCYRQHEFKRKVGPLQEAKRFRDEVRLKIVRREPLEPAAPPAAHLLATLCDEWAQGRSKGSALVARMWKEWAGGMLVADVTTDHLRSALEMLTQQYAPNTTIKYWNTLRSILAEAVDLEIISERQNPFRAQFQLPDATEKCNDFTRGQVLALLQEFDPANARMAKFAILTGLRCDEQYRLLWEMVSFEDRYFLLQKTKGKKPLQQPLSDEAFQILVDQRAESKGSPYCFPTPRGKRWSRPGHHRIWRPVFDKCGLEEYTWHDFRHALASVVVSSGESLFMVTSLLNHSDPTVAKRYARHQMAAKRAALEKVSVYFSGTEASLELAEIPAK